MNKTIASLFGFRGKLTAVMAFIAMLSFNTQVAFAQTATGQQTQKQTNVQSKTQTKATTQTASQMKQGTAAQTKVHPASDPLNGKTFEVMLTEKGKTTGEKDKLIFSGKKFESTHYNAAGFAKADYIVNEANGTASFTAKTASAKDGSISWVGTLKGNAINGMAVLTKPDKTVVNYSFKGTVASAPVKNDMKATN